MQWCKEKRRASAHVCVSVWEERWEREGGREGEERDLNPEPNFDPLD